MTRDHQHNPDPNVNAARIVDMLSGASNNHSAALEAAWLEWSSQIQGVDERGMALLKAAFESAFEAGVRDRRQSN